MAQLIMFGLLLMLAIIAQVIFEFSISSLLVNIKSVWVKNVIIFSIAVIFGLIVWALVR